MDKWIKNNNQKWAENDISNTRYECNEKLYGE